MPVLEGLNCRGLCLSDRLLQRINSYLVRWAKRKYKRLRTFKKVRRWWEGLTARQPRLFAHWT